MTPSSNPSPHPPPHPPKKKSWLQSDWIFPRKTVRMIAFYSTCSKPFTVVSGIVLFQSDVFEPANLVWRGWDSQNNKQSCEPKCYPPPPQTINFQSDELNFGYISLRRFKEWRNSMKQKEHGDFTSIIIA